MTWEILTTKGGTMDEKGCLVILLHGVSIHTIGDLLHASNLQHGTDSFTSPLKKGVLRIFFTFKYPMASAGFEPANLGTKGQHATPRPPKPPVMSMGNIKRIFFFFQKKKRMWFRVHSAVQFGWCKYKDVQYTRSLTFVRKQEDHENKYYPIFKGINAVQINTPSTLNYLHIPKMHVKTAHTN